MATVGTSVLVGDGEGEREGVGIRSVGMLDGVSVAVADGKGVSLGLSVADDSMVDVGSMVGVLSCATTRTAAHNAKITNSISAGFLYPINVFPEPHVLQYKVDRLKSYQIQTGL
jgi:hypothetical protein